MDAVIITDGPIEHLKTGWAMMSLGGQVAHYWREDKETMPPEIRDGGRVRYYTALCHRVGVTTYRLPALLPGNWPRCKHCQRIVKKHEHPL